MSVGKAQYCAKLVKKPGMPEARPCLRRKNHNGGYHVPDLTGLKDVFGYVEILRRAPTRLGQTQRWVALDIFGDERIVDSQGLFRGTSSGRMTKNPNFSTRRPEYGTALRHILWIMNKNHRHISYSKMRLFEEWDPRKNGLTAGRSASLVLRWFYKNRKMKPGPGYQLHVRKTKKYPHGLFGPGGIVWRHKMDRHDQDLLDLIHQWPKKKLREFVRNEIQPLLAA